MFTQGDDTASWLSDAEALAAVRRSNLMVYGVTLRRPPDQRVHGFIIGRGADGLTVQEEFDRTHSSRSNGGNGDVLRRAAEMTGGRVLDGDSAHLDDILSGVADEFRARYVLAFRPTTPSPGWHDLSVRVARRGVTVSARRGYAVGR